MDLPSLFAVLLLSKPPSMALQNALSIRGIPYIIAYDQRTHVMANAVWQWAQAHGIYWSYHIPHYPEATGRVAF